MKPVDDLALELKQQDATPRMRYGFDLNRRDLFKLLGGGMVVACTLGNGWAQESGAAVRHDEEELPKDIGGWIHIAENGAITVYTGKVEMGQNIRTSLAQQVAEELRVPMSSIEMVMGDTDLTPFDRGTFGSRTTPTMGPQLRKAAASARNSLIDMAVQRWSVSSPAAPGLKVENGKITHVPTGRTVTYGELSKGQKLVKLIGEDPMLTPASDWHIAGTSAPKVNGRDFVTGKHQYTSDVTRPGMLRGKVLRPNAFKAGLSSLDSSAAEKIANVKVVRDGNFVGVVAPDERTAARAIAVLNAQWSAPSQPSDKELFEYLRQHPSSEQESPIVKGSVEKARVDAHKTLEQTYTVAYIAHTPLEPRAAVAEWNGDKLTVWTGTQRPFAVREELSQAFHVPLSAVRVMVPDTGSAYGGKHTGDAAVEAARLARAAGKPVKLVWTREEEFTWAYFRPAGVIDVKSAVAKDGTVLAWEFHNYNSGPAAIATPYNIANQQIQFHPCDSPLRIGSYRGLAATANHFARESHMDELAHAVSMDPLEFRLKNIGDDRLRNVFETAAKKFGWGRTRSSSTRGFGIAGGLEKNGYVATCAEVEISGTEVRVRRVTEAWDSGAVVNPNGLQNQISGAIVQGLGGALFEAMQFDNGRILNPHLAEYRVPRFSDTPIIEVELVNRKDIPSAGAGETPLMGIAPAIGNAIFAATGVRLRSLPMVPDGLKASS